MLGEEAAVDIILPSDDQWQTKIYYQLVAKQRLADAAEDNDNSNKQAWFNYFQKIHLAYKFITKHKSDDDTEYQRMIDDQIQHQKETKLHEWNRLPKKTAACDTLAQKPAKKVKPSNTKEIKWTVSDIAKAGRLLYRPPMSIEFSDEQEMRRVYTLIYDVFRYKTILNEALNDASFLQMFPKLQGNVSHVWLLFYDLYHRNFKKRDSSIIDSAVKLLTDAGLIGVENALFRQKVKLAAAVARLRIKHNALSLSVLLPEQLKDEHVSHYADNNPLTCWANIRKITSRENLCRRIEKLFNLKMVEDDNNLRPNNFKWDQHCPFIIAFHNSMRSCLAKSQLVKTHELVVQDKSFCLGPATFGKVVEDLQLTGSVIQTHVNSPRSTAYLANVLSQNEKIKKLLVFGATTRKPQYETYFDNLGITNVRFFAEKLIDVSPDAQYMEEVVAVFATPPNSYTAVNDPVDLVCSRGGDLAMLEMLTEAEESKEGKERMCNILEEQAKTLRISMSRPQIQIVLYETHSKLETENNVMVEGVVKEVNSVAKIHHAALQGKIVINPSQTEMPLAREMNNNENMPSMDFSYQHTEDLESEIQIKISDPSNMSIITSNEEMLDNLVIPDTDIFDITELPGLCPNKEPCLNLTKEGCFLALLQRKQVIRLDNKYMIKMAEHRGLFGTTTANVIREKRTKGSKKKEEKQQTSQKKSKRRIRDTEISRIATPTHSFLRHTRKLHEELECPRCKLIKEAAEPSQYRQWWSETTKHILSLRSSLIRQKVIHPIKEKNPNVKMIANNFFSTTSKLDEVLATSHRASKIPIFPKLKLSRHLKPTKEMCPLHVTLVDFPTKYLDFTDSSSIYRHSL